MIAPSRSLHFRILLVSVVVTAVALIGTGLLLNDIFKGHIENRFHRALESSLNDLVAASEMTKQNKLVLNWRPSDPRYNTPFTGWYWLIYTQSGKPVAVSDSLPGTVDQKMLQFPDAGTKLLTASVGPDDARLKMLVRKIRPLGGESNLYFAVTGPESDIRNDVASFSRRLSISLFLVAAAFLLITFLQLRWILNPLRKAKEEIGQIRQSSKSELNDSYPREIQPLVSEVNHLLSDNSKMLDRARLQASNLAHAIKNPLTVMRNQSQGKEGEKMRQQIDKLDQNISRHLNRFRIAGLVTGSSISTPIAPVLEDIKHSVEIIHSQKQLDFSVTCESDLFFQGDQHDLEELLGNLVDNACKWALNSVDIAACLDREMICLTISDDGKGVPRGKEESIFIPGTRLDEASSGQGLGLAIVADIVNLYSGNIEFETKPELKGNVVRIWLPSTKAAAS